MNEELQKQRLWMLDWCIREQLQLQLAGECGFGRDCVGVIGLGGNFPDYEWRVKDSYERADNNGEVWTPKDAYHKHPCVAVLGRGPDAEAQLFAWLQWFEANDFHHVSGNQEPDPKLGVLAYVMGKHVFSRMEKRTAVNKEQQP